MNLETLPQRLAICKLDPGAAIPPWATKGAFFSVTRTSDELSIVCEQAALPSGQSAQTDWRALKVQGPLDFALTGILASLAAPLASAKISLFALSTFDTDYLLVKDAELARAIEALAKAGHVTRSSKA